MITYNKETPILLVVRGSNETVQQIYHLLQQLEPKRLYLAYDIPVNEGYTTNPEIEETIFSGISWKCIVKAIYNKANLGCNTAMLRAIRWFFRHETEGIVLDGFGMPFPAFFAFCSHLLEKYRDDERIGHISGRDFLKPDRKLKTKESYYFSKVVQVSSGWASWRRVWQNMDIQLKTFPAFKRRNTIEDIPTHKPFRYCWHYLDQFEKQWEDRYEYINFINNRLSIVPDTGQIPVNKYDLPEMNHPVFMVNHYSEELRWQEKKYQMPAITENQPEGFSFLMKKILSFGVEANMRIKIPRIIHQIYEDPAGPPANLLHIAESWKENHPAWEYRFWNRQMIHDFLESTCPDFIPYYHSYPFNVQRWDAIRYLILYHIGGMYADLDYECIRPLDVLLTDSGCCIGMEPTLHNKPEYEKRILVGNALMASIPGHPFMKTIIEDMKTNFAVDYRKKDSIQIMETTGPLMVSRLYDRYKNKKEITLLPAEWVTPLIYKEILMLRTGHASPEVLRKVEKAFAIHYYHNTWLVQTAEGKAWQKKINEL